MLPMVLIAALRFGTQRWQAWLLLASLMAMGITLDENRIDLLGDRLFIEDRGLEAGPMAWGPRIGIRVGVDTPWRAWVANNPAVSATRSSQA